MHFKRRSPSSAAHGYGSLAQEDNKPGSDDHEASSGAGQPPGGHGAGSRVSEATSAEGGSRTNPVTADGLSRTRSAGAVAPRGSQGRGANGAPRGEVWEQSFSMSPEVRFTRTPERVLKERRMKGASQPSSDAAEDRAREIAATRMDDPAPAVQERLQALRNKAASQETGPGGTRIFNRAPAQERESIKRTTAPAPAAEAAPRSRTIAEPAAPQRRSEQPAQPVRSNPVTPAAYEPSTVQQSYSFMWQPGTYLLDPSLQPAPAMPVQAKREEDVRPVRKATAPVRAAAPVLPRPPMPIQPEIAPWEDDEDYVEDIPDDEAILEEAPRRAAVVTQPRVSHVPAVPVPANDSV